MFKRLIVIYPVDRVIHHLNNWGQTDKMVYLGGFLTADGRYEKEVKRGIELARDAFHKMSRNINMQTRTRLVQCYIWATLLYGCETWTLTKIMESKSLTEAFEMWTQRKKNVKSIMDGHKTNEEVLKIANTYNKIIIINKL